MSPDGAPREARFIPDPTVVARRVADEFVLVPISQRAADVDSIFTLNEVAAFVWERLDGQRDFAALCDAVLAEFEVSREQAEADLARLLAQLERVGVVRRV